MDESQVEKWHTLWVQDDMKLKDLMGHLQRRDVQHTTESLASARGEAQHILQHAQDCLRQLERLTVDEGNEIRRAELHRILQRYKTQMNETRLQLRETLAQTRQRMETSSREILFQEASLSPEDDNSAPSVRSRRPATGVATTDPLQKEQATAILAQQVTSDLQSLSRLLTARFDMSAATHEHLALSSQRLDEAKDEFRTMSGHISVSGRLLGRFSRRAWTDAVLYFLAFTLFFLTCAFIVWRRIF